MRTALISACLYLNACWVGPSNATPGTDGFGSSEQSLVSAMGQGTVEVTLFLIGDAGRPTGAHPILEALKDHASRAVGEVAVMYLGDNLYESGLARVGTTARASGERRLRMLVDVAAEAGVKGVFIPGNHDWDDERNDGWRAIVDQQQFIDGMQIEGVTFLPKGGCPGPEILDLGRWLRVIILDTQWWLHDGPKPGPESSGCRAATEAEVLDQLDSALRDAGNRQTLIAAHHPFDSGGRHGGYFGWQDHFFPLRRLSPAAWLPLPGFGSLFVLARSVWKPRQDLANPRYRAMTDAILEVAARHDVLATASGHEHNLQVLLGRATRYNLVSGAGPSTGLTPVAYKDNTLFAESHWGFMRLDVMADGRVRLGVYGQTSRGALTEIYWRWLTT